MDRPTTAAQLSLDAILRGNSARDHDALEQRRQDAEARIARAARQTVALVLTENSHTMLSTRFADGLRRVRLHKMFLDAPESVLDAVGRYVGRADLASSTVIDEFIASRQDAIRPRAPRPLSLRPRGEVYDLDEVLRALSREYFDSAVHLPIGWGRAGTARGRRGRRTIRMGVYLLDERAIRIHPALDQPWIPRFFVEWVVFHEMVHHVVPISSNNEGRRDYHSAEFRAREAQFREYERAQRWERENLPRLIATRARAGRKRFDPCRSNGSAVDVDPRR